MSNTKLTNRNMEITSEYILRVRLGFEKIAKAPVKVAFIGGTLYGYCSELSSLRLLKAYRTTAKADCGYSENLNTFFFRLETDL